MQVTGVGRVSVFIISIVITRMARYGLPKMYCMCLMIQMIIA
jgi:hypothetical protein